MKSTLPLIRGMQLGFGVVVVVVFAVSVAAYQSVVVGTAAARWSEHTHEVLEHVERLDLAMENIETGYRDFAFSGGEAFLQLARINVPVANFERRKLRKLTSDNSSQQHRLDIIDDLAQQVIQRGDASVRLRRSGTVDATLDVGPKGLVDPTMDAFRAAALDMTNEERRLLQLRDADTERNYVRTRAALFVGGALALLIAVLAGWMVPRDFTERRAGQDKLRRLNRLYAMVSGISALGLRASDRDALFGGACQIAVEHGEFEQVWIGIVDAGNSKIVPMASAGLNEESMAAVKEFFSTKGEVLQGSTLAARAIREKTAVVSNDVQSDAALVFGKRYADSGIHSMAILPLIVADKAIGVFVLYTSRREFFDADGLLLLTELAGNVAFALDYIEQQERLERFAYYDALTGLANRRLFLDRVTQHLLSAASEGHKLALFLIDLERFKKLNDSLGRAAGDELLKQVAEWLAQNAGNVNLLARVGADHFAVAVPEVAYEADVVQLLEKTIAGFQNHTFTLGDAEYRAAAKVGVALFPDDGDDADSLFKNAEAALKKAKVSGDRYLFYAEKMTETVAGSLGIENRLRQALQKEEFVLHYQPKVSLASGRLTGAEALLRWNDPQNGLVPPARFISILEETGLIHEVGRWALHKAMADYQRWRSAGLVAPRIAVNVSPLQLRNKGFVAEIEEAIGIAADAGAGLELELTESLIMEDVNHSIVSLLAIRALGVTIAIDDFGTGFSSLSYLAKLPVDTLKIDRSFVVDMVSGTGGVTLISVIVNLAHALKLKVVAEGVETEEQLRQLRLLHCDEMQGYLFGKPVPREVFERRYLTRSAGLAALAPASPVG